MAASIAAVTLSRDPELPWFSGASAKGRPESHGLDSRSYGKECTSPEEFGQLGCYSRRDEDRQGGMRSGRASRAARTAAPEGRARASETPAISARHLTRASGGDRSNQPLAI